MRQILILTVIFFFNIFCKAQVYHVQDLTTTQIDSLDREHTIVLLPGGILEEHGPYLPSFTDGYMNLAITDSIAKEITKRPGMKVLIFPLIPLGNGGANEIPRKFTFLGTYSVRASTLRSLLMDIASEIGDQGFKKIIVIHMHGAPNHNHAIDQACDYFNDTYKGRMINIWNLGFRVNAGGVLDSAQKSEEGFTVHAGTLEHSMLYYLQPSLQKAAVQKAKTFKANGPNDLLRVSSENNWAGYWGSPHMTNRTIGQKAWSTWIKGILLQVNQILDNKYDFNQPTYYQIMQQDPSQNAVNADAIKHDAEKEAKQQAWLKSKESNK